MVSQRIGQLFVPLGKSAIAVKIEKLLNNRINYYTVVSFQSFIKMRAIATGASAPFSPPIRLLSRKRANARLRPMLLFDGFRRDGRGNVATTFAFLAIPLIFAVGMGADYANSARKWSEMNGFADAAALAAVSRSMMAQPDATAIAAAQNTFNAQVAAMSGVIYNPGSGVSVSIVDQGGARTATVNYNAQAINMFGGIIGKAATSLQGHSQASSAVSPNIDFYMLVDTSPSMAVPTTTAGINLLIANTQPQGGCAFACHESNPKADGLGNPGGVDNYTLAHNLNIQLRSDLLPIAVQNLISTAINTEAQNLAQYRIAINTFDYTFQSIAALSSNLPTVETESANIKMVVVYSWFYLTKSLYNDDGDTNWNSAINAREHSDAGAGSGDERGRRYANGGAVSRHRWRERQLHQWKSHRIPDEHDHVLDDQEFAAFASPFSTRNICHCPIIPAPAISHRSSPRSAPTCKAAPRPDCFSKSRRTRTFRRRWSLYSMRSRPRRARASPNRRSDAFAQSRRVKAGKTRLRAQSLLDAQTPRSISPCVRIARTSRP